MAPLHCRGVFRRNSNGLANLGRAAEVVEEIVERVHCHVLYIMHQPSQGEMYSGRLYNDGMGEFPSLDEPNERLMWARKRAGFEDATTAARRCGWNENTYRSHENGTRGITKKAATRYGARLDVPAEWILLGQGSMVPPIDPEVPLLWAKLTDADREEMKEYMRFRARKRA